VASVRITSSQRREREDQRVDRVPRPPAHQQQQDSDDADHARGGAEQAAQLHAPVRVEVHCEIGARPDREAEDPLAGVGALQGAARPVLVLEALELFGRALPQHLAAPAQITSGKGRRELNHQEIRQLQLPAPEDRKRAAVALQPLDVAIPGRHVERQVVDHAEPQPNGVGKIDCRHAPRIGVSVENPVGRESESLLWNTVRAPAIDVARGAAPFGG
jgi:hypothetical protein